MPYATVDIVEIQTNDFGIVEKLEVNGIVFDNVVEMNWKFKSKDLPIVTFSIPANVRINGKMHSG